jgi:hypothetical protein
MAPSPPLDGAIERNLDEVRALSPAIPEEVALGYHFCFGTLGGWPRFVPDDLGQAVALANAFVAASGRRVDWIHLPVLDRSDDAFFAPLAGSRRRARVSAPSTTWARSRSASRWRENLPQFGLGAYCGFGPLPPSELPGCSPTISRRSRLAAAPTGDTPAVW